MNNKGKPKRNALMPTSDYFAAANTMKGKQARKRIVAYVEGYDDILFWRMVLSEFEDETRCFEVMLPTRENLNKGKKQALITLMKQGMGGNMIACVDADYDYLLQGASPYSAFMLGCPYVVHTYAYAIENLQCYAPSLHNVCVMATLNDHSIFDFQEFLATYSRIVFPLFVWSIMLYRSHEYCKFSITDFNSVVGLKHVRLGEVGEALEKLRQKVRSKIRELQRNIPGRKDDYIKTRDNIMELGVKPETTYMYVQGHHLFENIVAPTLQVVCDELRREREREIRSKALHNIQLQNELSAYQRSQCDIQTMLRKNQGFTNSVPYLRMMKDIERIIE